MANSASYNAVVIQLARLGDLAQTWPLLERLSTSFGQGCSALVVDSRLETLAGLMVGRDNVFSLPVKDLLERFSTNSTAAQWSIAKRLRYDFGKIRAERVINLNYHAPASILAELPDSQSISGARWTDVKAGRPSDAQLAELFRANSGLRRGNRHLSEIWGDYARIDSPKHSLKSLEIRADVKARARAIFEHSGLNPYEQPLALIIGSGLDSRSWPIRYFQDLALSLHKLYPVVLTGSIKEESAASRIMDDSRFDKKRIVSLCGKTNPAELAGVLSLSRLAVGVDTGALHVAAMTGTKCLGIYYGSMHFRETGPFGDGNVVVVPDDPEYPCHEREMDKNPERYLYSVPPKLVSDTAIAMLSKNEVTPVSENRIFRSNLHGYNLKWQEFKKIKPEKEMNLLQMQA